VEKIVLRFFTFLATASLLHIIKELAGWIVGESPWNAFENSKVSIYISGSKREVKFQYN